MVATRKKRPFIPSEHDRRLASEVKRKSEELGQSAVAGIMGVHVRTLQRYIALQRSMRVGEVAKFEAHFGTISHSPLELVPPPPPLPGGQSTLEPVLSRYETQVNIKQAKTFRSMEATGLRLSEDQWEQIISAAVQGNRPSP